MEYLFKILFPFTLFLSFNLNAQIDGKFRHNICKFGPNCFIYKFNKNGTFDFEYHQDILGSGNLTGRYIKVGDTLKLTPDKVLFSAKSKLVEENYEKPDSIKISVKLQRASKKGQEDIQIEEWYVSINDSAYIKTNSAGFLILPKIKIFKIQIKSVLDYKFPEIGGVKLIESIFYPKSEKNSFEIFASESDVEIDLAITQWMTKLFIIKRRKLIPITFEPEQAYLGKEKTFYTKID